MVTRDRALLGRFLSRRDRARIPVALFEGTSRKGVDMNRVAKSVLALLALCLLAAAPASAQIQVFSTGQYGTPETISLAPPGFGAFGGRSFIPDFRLGTIWTVPVTGGPPTEFLPVRFDSSNTIIGGLFLPAGWGPNEGKFLLANSFGMVVVDGAATVSPFDPTLGFFSNPALAPAGFGPYDGHLYVTDQNGFIWRADPAGGGLTIFSDLRTNPVVNDPFGIVFTPPDFGAFSNRLIVSHTFAGGILALDAFGVTSEFAVLPLAIGQTGLRQMLVTPDNFLAPIGIPGRLLLLSVSGSDQGGGTHGALVALNPNGTPVAHLKEGTDLAKFDPRGMIITPDGNLLVSDTSDPIYLVPPTAFIPGPATVPLTALSPAHLWVGLKNSDDQGTQFDLKVELLRNGNPVASGLKRCVTGLSRNPDLAKESVVSFGPFDPVVVTAGDVLSLKVSARVGTNPDDTKCAGPGGSHNSALGLRLYYDAASRASRFDMTLDPSPGEDLYLHSDGGACGSVESGGVTTRFLSDTAPAAGSAKCKDSGIVNFAGGNAFSTVGTWSLAPLP